MIKLIERDPRNELERVKAELLTVSKEYEEKIQPYEHKYISLEESMIEEIKEKGNTSRNNQMLQEEAGINEDSSKMKSLLKTSERITKELKDNVISNYIF